MSATLHPDWPAWDPAGWAPPTCDFEAALATVAGVPVALDDVERVELYYVSYHGARWSPGDVAGSELEMVVLGVLKSGKWFALEAYNDYTGWGCRDSAVIVVCPTRAEAIADGLTESSRRLLGLPTVGGAR